MPLYTLFNQTIEASTPDNAVLKYARKDTSLLITYKKLHRLWKNQHAYSMEFQSFIDSTHVQISARHYYPLRNFEILLEEVTEV